MPNFIYKKKKSITLSESVITKLKKLSEITGLKENDVIAIAIIELDAKWKHLT